MSLSPPFFPSAWVPVQSNWLHPWRHQALPHRPTQHLPQSSPAHAAVHKGKVQEYQVSICGGVKAWVVQTHNCLARCGCGMHLLSLQADSTYQIHLLNEMVTRLARVFAWWFVKQYLVFHRCLNCQVEAVGIFLTFLQLVIPNPPKNLCGPWQPAGPKTFPAWWEMYFTAVCYAALCGREHSSNMTSCLFCSLSRYHGVSLIDPPDTLNLL